MHDVHNASTQRIKTSTTARCPSFIAPFREEIPVALLMHANLNLNTTVDCKRSSTSMVHFEGTIRTCWNYDPTSRPDPSEKYPTQPHLINAWVVLRLKFSTNQKMVGHGLNFLTQNLTRPELYTQKNRIWPDPTRPCVGSCSGARYRSKKY